METTRADYDADIVSEYQPPVPDGFDAFAAIPTWPQWQLDDFVSVRKAQRSYWTIHGGRAYKIVQKQVSGPKLGSGSGFTFHYVPRLELLEVKGRPKPGPRDWTLNVVATYELPGIAEGTEAREEIAAYRRRLPELLAALPAGKKK